MTCSKHLLDGTLQRAGRNTSVAPYDVSAWFQRRFKYRPVYCSFEMFQFAIDLDRASALLVNLVCCPYDDCSFVGEWAGLVFWFMIISIYG